MPRHPPGRGDASNPAPPVIIDGTGLSSTTPLLIKNGKAGSGVDLQVTGGAATGYRLLDSGGIQQGVFGFAVSASDWCSGAAAGDVVVVANGGKRLVLGRQGSSAALILDFNNGLVTVQASHKLLIDSSNSMTSVALQVNGDPNTGVGQIGGADTLGLIAGGVERARAGTDFVISPAGALATTATAGFLGIPTCAGPPTGAAADGSLVYDSTNFKLYMRTGGAWKSTAALT